MTSSNGDVRSEKGQSSIFQLESLTAIKNGDPAYNRGNYLLIIFLMVYGIEMKKKDKYITKGDLNLRFYIK